MSERSSDINPETHIPIELITIIIDLIHDIPTIFRFMITCKCIMTKCNDILSKIDYIFLNDQKNYRETYIEFNRLKKFDVSKSSMDIIMPDYVEIFNSILTSNLNFLKLLPNVKFAQLSRHCKFRSNYDLLSILPTNISILDLTKYTYYYYDNIKKFQDLQIIYSNRASTTIISLTDTNPKLWYLISEDDWSERTALVLIKTRAPLGIDYDTYLSKHSDGESVVIV